MPKCLITFLLAMLLAFSAAAQDDNAADPPVAEGAAAETDEEASEVEADEVDDSDLDEQTYEDDEDDFVPTQEIPSDEPISFPTNI